MKYTMIPAIISVTAALLSVVALVAMKHEAGPRRDVYRRLYDEVSVERDNLLGFIVRDHDVRAAAADNEHQLAVQYDNKTGGRTMSKTFSPWHGGDVGSGEVSAFHNGLTTTIVTIDSKGNVPAKTTFYLKNGSDPYLIVRERAIAGADAPYVDRWYFEAGEYVTHRSSDPTQKAGTIQYFYAPIGEDDLNRLKAQLASASDALSLPDSSQASGNTTTSR